MLHSYYKTILITTVGYLCLLAVVYHLVAAACIAVLLLGWLIWATWRFVQMCRIGAYRRSAEEWNRETFGFAAG